MPEYDNDSSETILVLAPTSVSMVVKSLLLFQLRVSALWDRSRWQVVQFNGRERQ